MALLLFRSFSYLGHAVIVLLAVIFVIMHKEPASLDIENSLIASNFQPGEKGSIKRSLDRATLAVKQCLQYWPWLWVMWFLLYILLSAFYFILYANAQSDSEAIPSWYFPILFNLLNNGTALVFFIMYYELSERTLDIDTPKGMWMILALFLILIAFVEFVVTLFTVTMVDANGEEILPHIQQAFSLLSGVLTGVATGLLAVRFGSRILEVPPIAMILLVLYAIIQPLFPLLSVQENATTISIRFFAVNIALYSKIALLVVIHWLRTTHQLAYYMARALQFLDEEGRNRLVFVNEFSPSIEKLKHQEPDDKRVE